jgi:hypothetical protein
MNANPEQKPERRLCEFFSDYFLNLGFNLVLKIEKYSQNSPFLKNAHTNAYSHVSIDLLPMFPNSRLCRAAFLQNMQRSFLIFINVASRSNKTRKFSF